jgi:hypothetical protein
VTYVKDKNQIKESAGWEGQSVPDGTLLVSNRADLNAVEISRHEVVHIMKRLEPDLFENRRRVKPSGGAKNADATPKTEKK